MIKTSILAWPQNWSFIYKKKKKNLAPIRFI